jgi:formylglycine-generating enzyme required for sulfatase activity
MFARAGKLGLTLFLWGAGCLCLAHAAMAQPDGEDGAGESTAQRKAGAEKELGGITFVWCPPGEYMQGASRTPKELAGTFRGAREEWYADARPRRSVRITGFWMSKTEITRSQWERVMNTAPWVDQPEAGGGAGLPATYVTWASAAQFAESFSTMTGARARLPREEEWEYACRAGTESMYSFGDEKASFDDHLWHWGNTVRVDEAYPHEAGKKPSNSWGLHDMHGNVWEWCEDVYGPYRADTEPPALAGGPDEMRVIRGASYADWASLHLSSYRAGAIGSKPRPEIGFRVVIEP